jgi:hypothetical protein
MRSSKQQLAEQSPQSTPQPRIPHHQRQQAAVATKPTQPAFHHSSSSSSIQTTSVSTNVNIRSMP